MQLTNYRVTQKTIRLTTKVSGMESVRAWVRFLAEFAVCIRWVEKLRELPKSPILGYVNTRFDLELMV